MTVDVRNSKNERAERTRRSRVLATFSPRSHHVHLTSEAVSSRALACGADLAELLSLWGFANPPYGDLNGDGVIGAQDLAILLDRWGPLY